MELKLLKCGCAAQSLIYINGINEKPVPGCGLHNCTEVIDTPDLSKRIARCTCGSTKPSSLNLAFFEYRGEGSRYARVTYGNCCYHDVAHRQKVWDNNPGVCKSFSPRGAHEFDAFYCGCRGWDW